MSPLWYPLLGGGNIQVLVVANQMKQTWKIEMEGGVSRILGFRGLGFRVIRIR